jgi:PAS domain S-box-containing protein
MRKVRNQLMLLPVIFLILGILIISIVRNLENKQLFDFMVSYRQEEEKSINSLFEFKKSVIIKVVNDYTYWDEMVNYVVSPNKQWSTYNLDTFPDNFDMDYLWILKNNKQLVYSKAKDNNAMNFPVDTKYFEEFKKEKIFHFFIYKSGKFLEIAGSTIHKTNDSNHEKQPYGYFIVAKNIDSRYIEELENFLGVSVKINLDYRKLRHVDPDEIVIYKKVYDFEGNVTAVFEFETNNNFYKSFKESGELEIYVMAIFSIIILFIFMFGVYFFVQYPLTSVIKSLKEKNTGYLKRTKTQKTEFGVIAKLIEDFFAQKNQLNKYGFALESSSSMVVITDIYGNVEYVNKMFTDITGYTMDDVKGENMRFMKSDYHPKEFYENMWETILQGYLWKGEFYNKKKNGELYWELASITSLRNEKGEIANFIATKEDITYLKEIENQLHQLIVTKDKFLSIIGHDLKNPFGSFIGIVELILEDLKDLSYEQIEEYLRLVYEPSKQGFNLLENLLTWAKTQTSGGIELSPEDVYLNLLIEENLVLLKTLATNKNIIINFISKGDYFVKADKNMVRTIVRNLINNALKFTSDGGWINIEINEAGDFYMIEISDNGIGIKKDDLSNLFQVHSNMIRTGTRGEVGSGLGLVLCKEFVEANGGTLWVESEVGKGSSFKFTLPKSV